VLATLAELVVRPLPATATLDSGLPPGAEELLRAFAGTALRERLRALAVTDAAEAARRDAALEVVRAAVEPACRRGVVSRPPP
jgi:hypothetical protein